MTISQDDDALSMTSDVHRYWNDEMTSGRTSPALSNSSQTMSGSTHSPPPPQSPSSESSEDQGHGIGASLMTSPEKSMGRGRKPHRMASSFELSDEQPMHVPSRRSRDTGDSFDALFGVPPAKPVSTRRCSSAAPVSTYQRRNRRAMPINPLTGEVLGSSTRTGLVEVPSAPTPVSAAIPNFSRFKRPPPGGYAHQLW